MIVDKPSRQRTMQVARRAKRRVRRLRLSACVHLGEPLGIVDCPSCCGSVRLKVFSCAAGHGSCTVIKPAPGHACCAECIDYLGE